MKKRKKSWYKPKGYLHFSARLGDTQKPFVEDYINNHIDNHHFYPLIHETISVRRYKAFKNSDGKIIRTHFNVEKHKPTKKDREIFYANHLDAQIYSYFSNETLGKPYEALLKSFPLVDKAVIAYRRIPIDGIKDPNKCNVHFAKELFDEISNRKNCVAVCYDIENFFPSLSHPYLEKCWANLLNTDKLTPSHSKILKSLTNYSYVEIADIIKACADKSKGLTHQKDFRKAKLRSYFLSPKEFREKIAKKNLIKVNKPAKGQKNLKGIPQGTPISAFLANLYLFEFDKFITEELVVKHGCFYRRYSDDIVLLFNTIEDYNKFDSIIRNKISSDPIALVINPGKTIVSKFSEVDGKLTCLTKTELKDDYDSGTPLRYLGFEFDGSKILVKSSSLSKFYREMKESVRSKSNQALLAHRHNKKYPQRKKRETKMFLTKSYRRFSHLGKNKSMGNYFSYIDRSSKILYPELKGQRNPIKKQVRRSWSIFNKTVKRYKDKLPKTPDNVKN